MTQYLLAVHTVEGQDNYATDDEMQQAFLDVDKLNAEMREKSVWVFGGGLHGPETATTVQVKDGDVVTTDGPFAEAKEQLGGFWILDLADLDEALAWASRATVACKQPVEVRPFQAE